MARSDIQIERMLNYFIDATAKLIKEEGIKNISIRKIAKEAGYTSSTIYNYFSEVSHLIFFAGMRFVENYIEDLPKYSARAKDPLEKYLLGWECFCDHSFREPELYHAIFIADLGEHPEELLKNYSSMYQSDTIQLPEELEGIVSEHNLSKRSREVLEKYAEKGVFKKEDVEKLSEITILIWQGMITSLLNNRATFTSEEASKKTMEYIRDITLNTANMLESK
ncbi:TetR/AcrR family transcriptional regulator [Peribacillus frigoritolerans]|uniref:TetR/AcrR family transcriptional regulator n=1 Tax=Peribacillus frigoritolerans TaxID=450367 RepID=UPI0007BF7BDA|nr:TetR/AcrR family transcriptional regulator [Peribacillus frigoritolerans]MCK2003637.1 TetR/AcrR family transcriptional regulator [Peribacillus frigoritolerans]MDG4850176.1 TetR/AcrR family transcriptional regulator [Peribacillus frigoritolerans]MED4697352.1 TetR/AcrR family transcriptional regulator [Peribacillus frigoritolerans]QNK47465.1 TetR/AcrR family transcriptional regulator [Brevibacterium sp. PAMC23299]